MYATQFSRQGCKFSRRVSMGIGMFLRAFRGREGPRRAVWKRAVNFAWWVMSSAGDNVCKRDFCGVRGG